MVLILSFLFYKKEPLKPLIFYILNADVFFSGSEFFSFTWGPYYGNICRGIIPIHTKKGAKIEVISATAEDESVIIRNAYAIINQYILLETERNVSGKYGQINISVT